MNPLWLTKLIPAAIGFFFGLALAWGIQSLRLTRVEQEFTAFKQDQLRIFQEAQTHADQQRQQASDKYDATKSELDREVDSGEVFRRCVAAGKCGVRFVRVPVQSGCAAGLRLPSTGATDAPGSDAVSTFSSAATEDPIVNECAVTTLMINQLQQAIEAQAGYLK